MTNPGVSPKERHNSTEKMKINLFKIGCYFKTETKVPAYLFTKPMKIKMIHVSSLAHEILNKSYSPSNNALLFYII